MRKRVGPNVTNIRRQSPVHNIEHNIEHKTMQTNE